MPRWIKQTDDYRCAPISVLNMRRCLGKPAPRTWLKPLCKKMGTTKNGGTRHYGRIIGALMCDCPLFYLIHPKPATIRKYLLKGWPMIVNEKRKDGTYHSYIIVRMVRGHEWDAFTVGRHVVPRWVDLRNIYFVDAFVMMKGEM